MACKIKQSDLEGFTGTSQYYRHWTGETLYTDGIHFLNQNGAAWLPDAVASYQRQRNVRELGIQFWHLEVKNNSAILTCRKDTGIPPVVTQKIEFTDFPFSMDIWVQNGTMLLPSEY